MYRRDHVREGHMTEDDLFDGIPDSADDAWFNLQKILRSDLTGKDPGLFQAQNIAVINKMSEILRNGAFYYHYQPIVDKKATILSLEALLRFSDFPNLEDMIAILEIHDAMKMMTASTFSLVIEDVRKLLLLDYSIPVSFNLSSSQLNTPGVAESIIASLGRDRIPFSMLIIEVTEHYLCKRNQAFIDNLHCLNRNNIELRLDDFGRGYSSLSSIIHFHFDAIKLDKSFIGHMEGNNLAADIILAVRRFADENGLTVIAEGVETERQLVLLCSLGIRFFQGYYFGKPAGLGEIIKKLEMQET